MKPGSLRAGHRRVGVTSAIVSLLLLIALPAAAQNDTTARGEEVFQQTCAACHQKDGSGVPGTFPPLAGNPHMADAAHLEDVIRNGLEGELEVNGVTYDNRMPSFGSLSDDDIAAVIAYIQDVLNAPAPAGGTPPTTTAAPSAGTAATELPFAAVAAYGLAFLIAAVALVLVVGPAVLAPTDRIHLPWWQAWVKTATIVVYFVVATVWLPSALIETRFVGELPRFARDLIGAGVWFVALALGIWALWWADREQRI